jgi:cadmium resistance protein CadD (predicted permease)
MGVSSSVILFAVIAFASTTADDLVVLVTFQSLNLQNKDQTTAEMMTNMWLISMGQVLSYTIIVGLSLLGLVLGNFAPEEYVSLIGFIPLFLGLKGVYDYFFDDDGEEEEEDKNNMASAGEAGNVSLVTMSPMVASSEAGGADVESGRLSGGEHDGKPRLKRSNSTQAIEHHVVHDVKKHDAEEHHPEAKEEEEEEEEESNFLSRTFDKLFSAIGLHPMVQKVAIAGLIVGADNVAVYISLFAKLKEIGVVLVALVIFYILLVFYIILSYFLVIKIPNVSVYIDRYAAIGIPVLLIVLGLFILSESILFELMTK